jgi:hypothetical protein
MKKLIVATILGLTTFAANASCYGTSSYRTCYDQNTGNSYTTSRVGNMSQTYGSNAMTGSTWSQNSTTLGSSTYINGTTNGRSWNETITPYSVSGTNSRGQNFYYNR